MQLGLNLSIARPAGLPWTPASLGGLLYRALPAAANVTLNGSKCASLADASGNGNTLAHGTDANRPTWAASDPYFLGQPSLTFAAASTQYLFASSPPIAAALSGTDVPMTVACVVRRAAKVTTNEEMIWSLGNSASGTQRYIAGSWWEFSDDRHIVRMRIRDDAGTAETTPRENTKKLCDLAPQILVFQLTGTAALCYVIGASQNRLYDATVNAFEVGSDYSAQGAINFDRFALGCFLRSSATLPGSFALADLCVYDRSLTQAERSQLVGYLLSRYVRQTIAAPTDLPGVRNWWAVGTGTLGAAVDTLADSVGGKDFTAAGAARPTLVDAGNGQMALRFDGVDDAMTAGIAADWPLLHNASSMSAFVVYRTVDANRDALEPILDTLDNAPATKNGLGLYHDNTGGSKHQPLVKVGAANATPVLSQATQNFGAPPQQWHALAVTFESPVPSLEENFNVLVDNEHFAAVDQGVTPAAGNPSHTLTLGKLAGSNTFAKIDVGEIIVFDRKLGRPGESQLVLEYLARKWRTAHVAIVGGNGLAGVLNDAAPHRAFPGGVQDDLGAWHALFRRAPGHNNSRGVGAQSDSGDAIRWSREQVIYDVDDANGRDFRAEPGMIRLRLGPHAGRLIASSKWSDDVSNIQVTGVPSTLLIGLSDDRAQSWTWSDPLLGKAINALLDYTASPNPLIELQVGPTAGRVLFGFTTSETGEGSNDQDIRLIYSDDGGQTWSDPFVVLHRDTIAWRATETNIVEFADGYLLMTIRDDTNHRIYTMDSTDGGLTWGNLTDRFAGWGRPMTILDENERVVCFFRSATSNKAVWNYSDDRGATWSTEQVLSNLQTTTGVTAYGTMTYAVAQHDLDGAIFLFYGLEHATPGDADVFARRWRNRRPTKAVQLAMASNQYLTRSHEAAWSLVGAAGFTVCGWLYRDDSGTAYFASKWAGAGTRQWLLYCGATDFLTARLSADGTNATVFTSTFDVSATGLWRFVALRWNPADVGAELAVFLDGQTKQTAAHAGGIATGGAALRLGASDLSLADSHDGRLHRWGFWSRALSDAEIADVRRGGRGYDWPDLPASLKAGAIAYYHLGQAVSTRSDASGNGQHLTPVNAPTQAEGVEI